MGDLLNCRSHCRPSTMGGVSGLGFRVQALGFIPEPEETSGFLAPCQRSVSRYEEQDPALVKPLTRNPESLMMGCCPDLLAGAALLYLGPFWS